jgi:hypothetical protein
MRFNHLVTAVCAVALLSSPLLAQDEAAGDGLSLQDTAIALAAESRRALGAGDVEAARRAMEGALALKPAHPSYLLGLAQIGLTTSDADLLFDALERYARAGLAFDLARLGDADASLREMQPDRYAELDALLARNSGEIGYAERAARVDLGGTLIEGIAVDIETDRIFLSDVSGRSIHLVEPFDRSASTVFADREDGLQSVFGMTVDGVNRVLWATTGALPQTGLSEEEAETTALVAFDLANGEVYRRYEAGGAERFADVVARDGIVYVSDSNTNRIYRLSSLTGSLALVSDDNRFSGLQGIALSHGALYAADYALGLWRIDLEDGSATMVRGGDESLIGIDGLGHTRDGRLIAVRNGMNPNQVFAIDLSEDGRSVAGTEPLLRGHSDFGEPTLLSVVDGRVFLVANSPWPYYPEDGSGPTQTPDPLTVLEIDLD